MKPLIAALLFLCVNTYVYYYFANEEIYPERASFATFPTQLDQWKCDQAVSMDEKVENILGVTDYMLCEFKNPSYRAPIGVYVGYHHSQARREGGQNANFIHPPKHCLPGSGWNIIDTQQVRVQLPGFPSGTNKINRFIIANGEAREIVYYWYQSRGRVIADDWKKVAYLFWDRMTRHRTDGSLVRFTIPFSPTNEQNLDEEFLDLASRIVPQLSAYVPN